MENFRNEESIYKCMIVLITLMYEYWNMYKNTNDVSFEYAAIMKVQEASLDSINWIILHGSHWRSAGVWLIFIFFVFLVLIYYYFMIQINHLIYILF